MLAVLRRHAEHLPFRLQGRGRPSWGRRMDLPLADTAASRFLAWIVAALTCGAALSVALVAAADGALRRTDTIAAAPVQVAVTVAGDEAGLADAVAALRRIDGVADIRLSGMMPTSGGETGASDVPLAPAGTLALEVWPQAGGGGDLPARLAAAVPGVLVLADDQAAARPLPGVLRGLGAALSLACIGLAMAVAAVVTRMSLDLHDATVDLLRLMGAPDRYVARQFEHHAWASGARGGLIGLTAAVFVLIALGCGLSVVPDLGVRLDMRWLDWLALTVTPLPIALGVGLATRYTAKRALARMR
ncbi:hypothetical protein [Marinivivus vitaminiproducens]|uniref:hypothetical protein n=1 Tax=Marinivivus vitaminiproducens TaxID=3035935 RepID=UPI0027AA538F|nr:hypothetical protein P4R82_17020 [Geminicoccaceae bacterium SCSIO 64248]